MPQIIDALVDGHKRRAVRVVNGLEMRGLERFEPGDAASDERRRLVERLQECNLRVCISRSHGKEQVLSSPAGGIRHYVNGLCG